MATKSVTIFGGGPSALAAAYFLDQNFDVRIFEKEKNVGQKFLVAGKGGFNLTNSLVGTELLKKYTPEEFLSEAILNFDSTSTREWLNNLGIETFIGTSGRIFASKKTKPFTVLKNIKKALLKKNIKIYTEHKFQGFDKNFDAILTNEDRSFSLKSDYYIFALGGASWSKTGSDGKWLNLFEQIGVPTKSFEPSNCGVNICWPNNIVNHHIGKALKNIEISVNGLKSRGEAVITEYGLEGNIIYSLIPMIRTLLKSENPELIIDFKPNNKLYELYKKMKNIDGNSTNYRKFLNIKSSELALIKSFMSKSDFQNSNNFISRLKTFPLKVDSLRPIEEAISTIGGISTSGLNKDFSLKINPNIYTIGEMVDWDAPTGGYLLQGCFSMGYYAAKSIGIKS